MTKSNRKLSIRFMLFFAVIILCMIAVEVLGERSVGAVAMSFVFLSFMTLL